MIKVEANEQTSDEEIRAEIDRYKEILNLQVEITCYILNLASDVEGDLPGSKTMKEIAEHAPAHIRESITSHTIEMSEAVRGLGADDEKRTFEISLVDRDEQSGAFRPIGGKKVVANINKQRSTTKAMRGKDSVELLCKVKQVPSQSSVKSSVDGGKEDVLISNDAGFALLGNFAKALNLRVQVKFDSYVNYSRGVSRRGEAELREYSLEDVNYLREFCQEVLNDTALLANGDCKNLIALLAR